MTDDDWMSLPEGHFAIVDPHDPEQVTYWRRKDVTTRSGGSRPEFAAYPAKARNGPTLLKRDVPKGLTGKGRFDWANAWHDANSRPYKAAVIAAIAADPIVAGQRFADLTSRCCACARTLTDDHSKVYGIGPDCRDGIPVDVLALYFTPQLGRAHAAHLAREGAPNPTLRKEPA